MSFSAKNSKLQKNFVDSPPNQKLLSNFERFKSWYSTRSESLFAYKKWWLSIWLKRVNSPIQRVRNQNSWTECSPSERSPATPNRPPSMWTPFGHHSVIVRPLRMAIHADSWRWMEILVCTRLDTLEDGPESLVVLSDSGFCLLVAVKLFRVNCLCCRESESVISNFYF